MNQDKVSVPSPSPSEPIKREVYLKITWNSDAIQEIINEANQCDRPQGVPNKSSWIHESLPLHSSSFIYQVMRELEDIGGRVRSNELLGPHTFLQIDRLMGKLSYLERDPWIQYHLKKLPDGTTLGTLDLINSADSKPTRLNRGSPVPDNKGNPVRKMIG